MGQQGVAEVLHQGQAFRTVQRPGEVLCIHRADGLHSVLLQHLLNVSQIVIEQQGRRCHMRLRWTSAVLLVEVPLTTDGGVAVHQQPRAFAHHPVEAFHQVLLLACEERAEFIAGGEEMLGIGHFHRCPVQCRMVLELLVQAVFVGQLIAPGWWRRCCARIQPRLSGIDCVLRLSSSVRYSTRCPLASQLLREATHGPEEAEHLLHMVPGVVGLLAHFHQHVQGVCVTLRVPGVCGVELIAQDQADAVCGTWFLFLRHRSLQYFTSSHTFSHFLRHWNGRPHTAQVREGRSAGGRWRGTVKNTATG
jgi:hypothetical protein